jgi:hypothetical protein
MEKGALEAIEVTRRIGHMPQSMPWAFAWVAPSFSNALGVLAAAR